MFSVTLTVSMLHKVVDVSLILEDVSVVVAVGVCMLLVTVTVVMIPNAVTISLTVPVLMAIPLCFSLI